MSRTVHADPKLRVEYALTPLGRSVLEPLAAACRWATEHWDELLDAREGGEGHRAASPPSADSSLKASGTEPLSRLGLSPARPSVGGTGDVFARPQTLSADSSWASRHPDQHPGIPRGVRPLRGTGQAVCRSGQPSNDVLSFRCQEFPTLEERRCPVPRRGPVPPAERSRYGGLCARKGSMRQRHTRPRARAWALLTAAALALPTTGLMSTASAAETPVAASAPSSEQAAVAVHGLKGEYFSMSAPGARDFAELGGTLLDPQVNSPD